MSPDELDTKRRTERGALDAAPGSVLADFDKLSGHQQYLYYRNRKASDIDLRLMKRWARAGFLSRYESIDLLFPEDVE